MIRMGPWPAVASLVQRGDITLWISVDAVDTGRPAPPGRRGGQRKKPALRALPKDRFELVTWKDAKVHSDSHIAPKKAYVSLRRNKQFGLIQPSTATRVDVGLRLGDMPPAGRLEASGSFNSMVTHRVRINDAKDIDAELLAWLEQAYEAS